MTSSNTSSSCGYDGTACHDGPVGADLNRQLSCLGCHVAHGTTATMTPYAQIPWPGDNATTDDGLPGTASANYSLAAWNWDGEWNTRSSLLRLDNRGVCQNSYCHPKGTGAYLEGLEQGMDYGPYTHVEGEESDCAECHRNKDAHQGVAGADCSVCHAGGGSGGCTACHGAPPATGAHAAHFGGDASPTAYGGTNNLSNATDYAFDCGTCHPVSPANHLNGSVDIELYNASAPEGSLKSLNPPTASYTLGTCSDVYCHSKTDWSSPDPISSPLLAPDGNAMLDANGNLVYDPYVVTVSTVYTSIGWNDGPRDCNGCHRNNPQTAWPDVQASVGNTHGWISDWGWEDLHAWVHGFEPIPCRSCHNSTVAEVMTYSRDAWDITYFDDAAIANKVNHVNGVKDVVFDPVNPVVLRSSWDLSSTTYDLETKVCSSVPCHLNQPNPEWGKPYRWGWGSLECDQCHRYGGPWPPVVGGPWPPSASGSAATQGIPSSSTLSAHQQYSGQNCLDCHQRHGPRQ